MIEFREKLGLLVEDVLRKSVLEPRGCEECAGVSAEDVRLFEAAIREKGLEAGVAKSVGRCAECSNAIEEWDEGVRGRIWRGVPIAAGEYGGWDAIERAADD